MEVVYVLVGLVVLCAIVTLSVSYAAAMRGIHRLDYTELFRDKSITSSARVAFMVRITNEAKQYLALPRERVEIKSRDGLKLYADLTEAPTPKGLVLFFHGFRSKPEKDFGAMALCCRKQGYSVLLVDQRTHNRSEGRYICYGVKERYDCLDWIKYVQQRFGDELPLFLAGQSMGATTVMLAASLGVPKAVKGLICDCGFSSAYEEMGYVLTHGFHLPRFPILPLMGFWCRLIAGFGIREGDAPSALTRNTVPALFFHGKADDFVPYSMGVKNYNACASEKELISVEGARHCCCWYVDTERCESAFVEFLKRYTPNK